MSLRRLSALRGGPLGRRRCEASWHLVKLEACQRARDAAPARSATRAARRARARGGGAAARGATRCAVAEVTRLHERGRADVRLAPPRPTPLQRERDELPRSRHHVRRVDAESLMVADDSVVSPRANRPRGAAQAEARPLGDPGRRSAPPQRPPGRCAPSCASARRRPSCLRVVHGKGHGSPGESRC